jgi:hypothetical protein
MTWMSVICIQHNWEQAYSPDHGKHGNELGDALYACSIMYKKALNWAALAQASITLGGDIYTSFKNLKLALSSFRLSPE